MLPLKFKSARAFEHERLQDVHEPSFLLVILPGDYCEGATPVPIPNTEVKPFNADGTAFGWESRSSPGFFLFIPLRLLPALLKIVNPTDMHQSSTMKRR